MGGQYKGCAAPLAKGVQAPAGDRSISHGAAMGLCHKFHQFPSFGKRPARSMSLCATSSTSCHIVSSLKCVVVCFLLRQPYQASPGKSLIEIKKMQIETGMDLPEGLEGG